MLFALTDSYGDGWNGNQLTVSFSDGTPTQNLTIQSGSSANYTLEIGMGVHVTLGWISGSYTSECSFTVSYVDGDQITASTGSSLGSGYHFEFDVNCGGEPIQVTLNPVTELAYELDEDNHILLTWEKPDDAVNFIIERNDEVIGNATANFFLDESPVEFATYCVTAQYILGNSEPECFQIEDILGVDETESNFRIYPNPVNNTLYINGGNAEFSYVLLNGMGQEVVKGTAQGTQQINVANMNKGVYFLRLSAGNQVKIQKVVVE